MMTDTGSSSGSDTSKHPEWSPGDEVCFHHTRAMRATVTSTRYDPNYGHQLVEIDLFPGEFAGHLFVKWGV